MPELGDADVEALLPDSVLLQQGPKVPIVALRDLVRGLVEARVQRAWQLGLVLVELFEESLVLNGLLQTTSLYQFVGLFF